MPQGNSVEVSCRDRGKAAKPLNPMAQLLKGRLAMRRKKKRERKSLER